MYNDPHIALVKVEAKYDEAKNIRERINNVRYFTETSHGW